MRIRRTVARLARQTFPALASSVVSIEAAALRSPGIPALFSRDLYEIPPTLNEDLLDLHGHSEQLLSNRFTFLHRTETLEEKFDWNRNQSPAWRSELHAFDHALDFALTYRISQEEQYARHLRYLIAHWISENPPFRTPGWEPKTLARRVRNWILASDIARGCWERDPDFLFLLGKSLAMQCIFLDRHTPFVADFATAVYCARALLFGGMFFRGASGESLRQKALAILSEAVDVTKLGFSPAHGRLPTEQLHLAHGMVELLLLLAESGEDLPYFIGLARRVLRDLEGVLLPDGTLPLFGPSASPAADDLADLYAVAAVILNEPTWNSLAGKFGILPYMWLGEGGKTRFEQLPSKPWVADSCVAGNLGVFRLGGEEKSAMIVSASRGTSPPDHHDHGSYELSLNGHRLVVDSGAFSPEGETWDAYFASAQAHNVLLIDGDGLRAAFESNLHAGAKSISGEGYEGLILPEVQTKAANLRSRRAFFRFAENTWGVFDRVTGTGEHTLTNLVHLYPTFGIETQPERAIIRSRAMSATFIPIGTTGGARFAMNVSRGQDPEYAGWFSPDIGVKFEACVLALRFMSCRLPWMGGYLIVPGVSPDFCSGDSNASDGRVSFGLSGRKYVLSIPQGK